VDLTRSSVDFLNKMGIVERADVGMASVAASIKRKI
jgi:hypothetical protein